MPSSARRSVYRREVYCEAVSERHSKVPDSTGLP
jgi:hypothetical protein